jgi:hypothetical protein
VVGESEIHFKHAEFVNSFFIRDMIININLREGNADP